MRPTAAFERILRLERIYLDNNATTSLDPRVLQAMLPYLEGRYGNASSLHWFGQEARRGMDLARQQVADLLDASPEEVIFTSGGTEADNQAILGAASCWDGPAAGSSPPALSTRPC